MRPLSRLLSVFLALILLGGSLMTVTANEATPHVAGAEDHQYNPANPFSDADPPARVFQPTGALDKTLPTYGAKLTIARVDTKATVYPGDTLKFLVIIERGTHVIPDDSVLRSVYKANATVDMVDGTAPTTGTDVTLQEFLDADEFGFSAKRKLDNNPHDDGDQTKDAIKDLDGSAGYSVLQLDEVEYKVGAGELGSAQSRSVPIQFELLFDPDGGELGFEVLDSDDSPAVPTAFADLFNDTTLHSVAGDGTETGHSAGRVRSNTVMVQVTKKGDTGDGASEVTVNVDMERPDDIEAGEAVKFTVSSETGKYAIVSKPLIVRKQYFDADGDKVGGAVPVAVFTLAALQSNSVSAEASKSYTLVQDDIDAESVEFSWAIEISAADLTGEPGNYKTDKTQKGTFMLAPPAPEAAPEPTPEPAVGMTESATVTKGEGNLVDITRHDGGANFSVAVGLLTADGMLTPHPNGYIRDNDLGQTYAVVNREPDNKIVRVWISSSSPHVGSIDWTSVLDFYNVPVDVVNAIPLDHTTPSANQLVDAGGTWYVYTGGAWRHIPDIPTFQSRGYYHCDLTTAMASWADNIMLGQALPASGGAEDPDYPVCR